MTILYETLGYLGIFVVVSLIHEFGHILTFYHYKKRWQKLHLRWWGLEVGTKAENSDITLRQDYFVRAWGILAGYFALTTMITMSPFMARGLEMMLLYVLMCMFDIQALMQVINHPEMRDWRYNEIKIVRVIPK